MKLTEERLEILWDQIDKSSGWCYHEFARAIEAEVLRLNGITGDGRGEAVEMSPEFTDTSRAALCWVLWHHQGASSKIGHAMRFALGMGLYEQMSDRQVAAAKSWAAFEPPPHPQRSCNYPDCKCPTESPCLKGLPQQQQAAPGAVPDGWQPIETAPKDGPLVAVFWLNSDGEEMHDLDYTEDGCWVKWHDYAEHVEIIGGNGVSYTPPYTHWKHLGAPKPQEPASIQEQHDQIMGKS